RRARRRGADYTACGSRRAAEPTGRRRTHATSWHSGCADTRPRPAAAPAGAGRRPPMMRWLARFSPRERAIVVGGAAILPAVGLWLSVVTPLRERNTATAELVPERERLLVRRLDLLARRGQIASELQAANARLDRLNTRLLTAASPAVVASELQK